MVILLEMLKPPKSGKRFVTTLLKQQKIKGTHYEHLM